MNFAPSGRRRIVNQHLVLTGIFIWQLRQSKKSMFNISITIPLVIRVTRGIVLLIVKKIKVTIQIEQDRPTPTHFRYA
jgi:hypothetical protein